MIRSDLTDVTAGSGALTSILSPRERRT